MSFETISVIGLGYIGLPTAAMFASRKKKVVGVDVNEEAVETINRGEIHIVEPELDIIVRSVVKDGYLKAVTSPEPADAFLIAVPTPFKSNGSEIPEPDLSYIEKAAKAIAPVLKKGSLVILESTSPVGATEQLAEWLYNSRPDLSFPQQVGELADVSVAHCPERVLPGQVVRELVQNDRVIGGMSKKCTDLAAELYKTFVEGECVKTNARTAEMAKLTENSCRDVQIAFANELSMICDRLGIDVWELIALANRHPRINILQPGAGVGGHCIAVDPWFVVSKTPELTPLIKQARLTNDIKPRWVIKKVVNEIESIVKKRPIVACFGLAFKPNIDDLRESPALHIVREIYDAGLAEIMVVEPNIKLLPKSLKGVSLVDTEIAIEKADILLMLVAHDEFNKINPANLENKVVFDPCGVLRRK